MPTISVVVPVYKVEAYLHCCVDSILSQTFEDFELILVDDGSPDNCGVMCEEYAKKDNRVRVIHQENQGQAAARNHGVSIAKGEWICFVDSDDAVHPQMLEILFSGIRSSDVKMTLCDITESENLPAWDFMHVDFKTKQSDCEETLFHFIKNGRYRYWSPCAKLIKKELFDCFPFPKGRIYEDNAVVFLWIHEANCVADCEAALYWYRKNEQSTTKSAFSAKRLDYLNAIEDQIVFYAAHHYDELCNFFSDEYFRMLIDFYDKVASLDNAKSLRSGLRFNARRMYRDYKSLTDLTDYEQSRLQRILHPMTWKLREYVRR